jgi:hypothetical protein
MAVCMMVTASLLMAAVSNAGKTRSVEEENQRYLAVSSALQLVTDDLKSASYQGHYTLSRQITGEGEEAVETRAYTQTQGTYSASLHAVLLGELDYLFGQRMQSDLALLEGAGDYTLALQTGAGSLVTHTLTVTPDVDGLRDTPVTVTVTLTESYAIYLTASEGGYTMQAELTPAGNEPYLSGIPSGDTGEIRDADGGGMTWKLGWIKKGG